MRRVHAGDGRRVMNRPFVFYAIVAALGIVLGVIGVALYACGVK